MISIRRAFFATSLAILSWSAFSEAPVVDESENFALFDKQQAANSQPVYNTRDRLSQLDSDTPLAHEDSYGASNTGDNAALLNKIQGLQQDVQELRGQLEVQTHELNALKQQQLEFYKDLDGRMRQETPRIAQPAAPAQLNLDSTPPSTHLESMPSVPASSPPPAANPTPIVAPTPLSANAPRTNPADEQISYLAAYELINNKHFDEALPAMQSFVAQYPQGGYTANAQYWIGELYMVKKNYPEAIQHFERVLQEFPSSSKSSASMLKIGYALAAAGELNLAKQRLQSVITQYPDTHAAQLAFAKLESISNK